jgi:tRNA (guanine-N7-)-methyltransferase
MLAPLVTWQGQEAVLYDLDLPFEPERLIGAGSAWEVEIGYGKGRFLLRQCLEHPELRFLGVELVSRYFRELEHKARRHGVKNLVNIRGEALFLLSTLLPRGFAQRVHVYFPDPWPKTRHHRRRLFDEETVDLVLSLLAPGGELVFATDFLDYGALVLELLESHPELEVERVEQPWPDGARTNYEAKYLIEGRPIIRLRAKLTAKAGGDLLHPRGQKAVRAALTPPRD